jgi:hypothetical protein
VDAGYFSAIAALSGSAIGGLTSLTASWLSQSVQARTQQRIQNVGQRQELYRAFIEEASRLYARALETNEADIADMVGLYAMASRTRVLSSPAVSDAADGVVRLIIDTYFEPNMTLSDIRKVLASNRIDPLRTFSEACRQELVDLRTL